jgi:hypothetical protein
MEAVSLSAPQTLNLYAYCGNDPVNRVDPDGLFWGWIKKFFSWIVNTIRTSKIVRRIAIRFVVSFVMSGGNLGVAVRSIVPDILAALGLAPPRFAVTPSWNPDLPYPVSYGGIGSLSRYIIVNYDTVKLLAAINTCIAVVFGVSHLVATGIRVARRWRNGVLSLKNTNTGTTHSIETGVNFTRRGVRQFSSILGQRAPADVLGYTPPGDPNSTITLKGRTYSTDGARANYVVTNVPVRGGAAALFTSMGWLQIHEDGHSIAQILGRRDEDGRPDPNELFGRREWGDSFSSCVYLKY